MFIKRSETKSSQGGLVPEMTYRVRCLGTKFKSKNSSGNPMTTLNCEIIQPEEIEINGKPVTMAGKDFALFLTHNFDKDGWGSQEEVLDFCRKLGVQLSIDPDSGEEGYDCSKADEYFKGMEWDMILRSKEDVKRYQTGPNQGQPILDGEGKEISAGQRINARPSDVLENCHPSRNEEIAARPF